MSKESYEKRLKDLQEVQQGTQVQINHSKNRVIGGFIGGTVLEGGAIYSAVSLRYYGLALLQAIIGVPFFITAKKEQFYKGSLEKIRNETKEQIKLTKEILDEL